MRTQQQVATACKEASHLIQVQGTSEQLLFYAFVEHLQLFDNLQQLRNSLDLIHTISENGLQHRGE
ncbi:hypothetical protein L195_g058830 [Trifolium pratense]|uniref:Uncharacterized protein n=1 Tax=Trifolium pratense TaxID=57577 RepID=A0A2K3JUL8_TRIPR|nr:hypothetical protein L195_g058830 [Trifolium pratense]